MAKRPDRVISGTKALGQSKGRVIKATGGNVEKIRCPGCQTLAHPRSNGRGGTKILCANCGREFQFTSM